MPTLLVWQYHGGEDGSAEAARRGEQLCYAGDAVMDDVFKEGKAVRLDGGDMVIEFCIDGKLVHKPRSLGHVYALASSL